MQGHLKVTEIYDDHQEVVVDECNMLTDGISVDIVDILVGDTAVLGGIKPNYLQVGVSTVDYDDSTDGSSTFFHLSTPLSTADSYGNESYLELRNLYRSFVASSQDAAAANPVYQEMLFASAPLSATTPSSTPQKEWFAVVKPQHKSKIFLDCFAVRLKLDKNSANGYVLNEFGLFSKNPFGYKEDRPLLIAYKRLGVDGVTEPITKRAEFELLVEWSVGFIGNSTTYDNVSPGDPDPQQEPRTSTWATGPGNQGWSWLGNVLDQSWQAPGYIPNLPPSQQPEP